MLGYADLSHRVTASRETEPRTETRGTSQVSAAAGHCTPAAVLIRIRVQEFLNFDIDTVRYSKSEELLNIKVDISNIVAPWQRQPVYFGSHPNSSIPRPYQWE